VEFMDSNIIVDNTTISYKETFSYRSWKKSNYIMALLIVITIIELIYGGTTGTYWLNSSGGFIALSIPLMPFLLFIFCIIYSIISLILYISLIKIRKKYNVEIPKKLRMILVFGSITSILIFPLLVLLDYIYYVVL